MLGLAVLLSILLLFLVIMVVNLWCAWMGEWLWGISVSGATRTWPLENGTGIFCKKNQWWHYALYPLLHVCASPPYALACRFVCSSVCICVSHSRTNPKRLSNIKIKIMFSVKKRGTLSYRAQVREGSISDGMCGEVDGGPYVRFHKGHQMMGPNLGIGQALHALD